MGKSNKTIESIEDLRTKYPKGYEYLLGKRGTSIYLDGACAVVENAFHNTILRYDIHDIIFFNKSQDGPSNSTD